MALESRRGGGQYFYDAHKVGGRVVKRYVGAGPLAQLAAELAKEGRAAREAERTDRVAARAAFDAQDADIDDLCEWTERLVQATLLASGYRRHDRGSGGGNDERARTDEYVDAER
jgi:hypothetical protein